MATTPTSVKIFEFDFNDDTLDLNFPSVQTVLSTAAAGATPTDPIAISISTTTTSHTKDLHEFLQSSLMAPYALKLDFTYTIIPPQSYTAAASFSTADGTLVKLLPASPLFPSKKAAKEFSAGAALEYIRTLPAEIRALPVKVASEVGSASGGDPKETENWVGLLQDYTQPRGKYPVYTFYNPPDNRPEFSCDVTGIPGLETLVFGDKTRYHRNKKIAKVQAAKAAVQHIQSQPDLAAPTTTKHASPDSVPGTPSPTFQRNTALAPPGSVITVPARLSPVEKVMLICPRLGLSLPEYTFTQDVASNSIYDVVAIVRRRATAEGKKGVRMGLKNIYGKKKAKENMAESVLRWLENEAKANHVTISMEGS